MRGGFVFQLRPEIGDAKAAKEFQLDPRLATLSVHEIHVIAKGRGVDVQAVPQELVVCDEDSSEF